MPTMTDYVKANPNVPDAKLAEALNTSRKNIYYLRWRIKRPGYEKSKRGQWQRPSSKWPDNDMQRLKTLWPDHPTATIATMMGRTKNQIIGKAWRLGLPAKA